MNINKYNYLYSGTARRAFEPTAPAFAATYGCHHTDILFNRLCSFVFSTAIVRTISGATSSRSLAQEANFGHRRLQHLSAATPGLKRQRGETESTWLRLVHPECSPGDSRPSTLQVRNVLECITIGGISSGRRLMVKV